MSVASLGMVAQNRAKTIVQILSVVWITRVVVIENVLP
jgi:hypothetical protein